MQDLSTWFWFDGEAEEAARFYADLFGGEVTGIERTPEGTPFPAGQVMTASFRILGHSFHALNGGAAVSAHVRHLVHGSVRRSGSRSIGCGRRSPTVAQSSSAAGSSTASASRGRSCR